MALSQNSQLLVNALQALPLLDGRFEQIKLVNFNSFNNQKRGCFSLVFSAYDKVEGVQVALKFYDIDPQWLNDNYRRAAFRREHEILQALLTKERCLQLASALSTYNFVIPTTPGNSVTIPCEYFAVEWIEKEIDDFFLKQHTFDPLDKLHLFNELTLAVEALHRHEVFHRDLKPDNLRAYQKALKRVVVTIDLGTAARHSSAYLQSTYQHQVGALAYAAPEAVCGLAGHRKLAPYTDVYAIGCLLYELFNKDLFFRALLARNPRCQAVYAGLQQYLQGATTEAQQLTAWRSALAKHSAGVQPVDIAGPGTSVPPGIASLLNDALRRLTHVDFANRPIDLKWVRGRTWAAIKTLENERVYQKRLAAVREMRRRKIDAQQKRAAALIERLSRVKNAN
jgi:serine/threonine protein kinase